MAKRSLSTYEPASITIDAELELQIRVKRLTIDESAKFERLFWRAIVSEADRLVLVRRPGEEQERHASAALSSAALEGLVRRVHAIEMMAPGDEQRVSAVDALRDLVPQLTATDLFIVPDEEVRRRRLVEMTDDQRKRYDALREADAVAYATFLADALAEYVKVDPDQLEIDGVDVLDGAQLARCYGSRADVLNAIVREIRHANELSDAQKKALRSRSTSSPSSNARDLTATGASSAPTAAPAELSGSATTAVVTPTAASSSGPTVN